MQQPWWIHYQLSTIKGIKTDLSQLAFLMWTVSIIGELSKVFNRYPRLEKKLTGSFWWDLQAIECLTINITLSSEPIKVVWICQQISHVFSHLKGVYPDFNWWLILRKGSQCTISGVQLPEPISRIKGQWCSLNHYDLFILLTSEGPRSQNPKHRPSIKKSREAFLVTSHPYATKLEDALN